MVNRIWQHMIGHGIVRSTEDFGVTGQFPSHPELLDYLAVRFIESGWSVKSLVKDIAMSRVYRMSSTFNQDYHEYDSDNVLVWRANPRRLDAEAIRDAMLSASGELNDERPRGSEVAKAGYTRVQGGAIINARVMAQSANGQARGGGRMRFNGQPGGQSQFGGGNRPFQRPGQGSFQGRFQGRQSLADQRTANQLDMEDAKFRSVYLPVVRDEEPRCLAVFDFADSNAITGTRESSNTADQSLYMLNNRFVIQQSAALAQRITDESSNPRADRKRICTDVRPTTHVGRAVSGFDVRPRLWQNVISLSNNFASTLSKHLRIRRVPLHRLTGAGNLMVFNNNNKNAFSMNLAGNSNGSNRPGGFNRNGRDARDGAMAERAMRGTSNVHELRPLIGKDGKYAIGSDGKFEVKKVWFWEEKGFFASTQGSAKRLLNGNTLLANTGKQFVIEVTPEGNTVARYKGTAPVYKAFKYTKEQIGVLIDSSKNRQDKEKDD